jgi:hypothetical protein
MPVEDKRNVLRVGSPEHPGGTEITPAMVETVRQCIKDAGGVLTVWAVLHEDVYETRLGDGFYLHVHGLALNSADAQRLADLAGGDSEIAVAVPSPIVGTKQIIIVGLIRHVGSLRLFVIFLVVAIAQNPQILVAVVVLFCLLLIG